MVRFFQLWLSFFFPPSHHTMLTAGPKQLPCLPTEQLVQCFSTLFMKAVTSASVSVCVCVFVCVRVNIYVTVRYSIFSLIYLGILRDPSVANFSEV